MNFRCRAGVLALVACCLSGCYQYQCSCNCFPVTEGIPPSNVDVEICMIPEAGVIAEAFAQQSANCPMGTKAESCGCQETKNDCSARAASLTPTADRQLNP